jgi:hypothetical protein
MAKNLVRSPGAGATATVPALYAVTAQEAKRFIEYFAAKIRNPNTRRAYFHAVLEFSSQCEAQNFTEIIDIEPLHVAAYIEQLSQRLSKPSVKQHLAAIRMLFDGWSWARLLLPTSRPRSEARNTPSGEARPPCWRKRKRASFWIPWMLRPSWVCAIGPSSRP